MVCKIITSSEKGAYKAPSSKIYTIQSESCILDGSYNGDNNETPGDGGDENFG